jgi:hypothetical protein
VKFRQAATLPRELRQSCPFLADAIPGKKARFPCKNLNPRNGAMSRIAFTISANLWEPGQVLPSYRCVAGKSAMTVPALILASLLALVALPVVSQITSGSSNQSRPTGIHGSKDTSTRSADRDDGSDRRA